MNFIDSAYCGDSNSVFVETLLNPKHMHLNKFMKGGSDILTTMKTNLQASDEHYFIFLSNVKSYGRIFEYIRFSSLKKAN